MAAGMRLADLCRIEERDDLTTAAQRLQVQQQYSDASIGSLKQAQGNVTSLFTSTADYAHKLQTGSDSPLAPQVQYDLASSQFNALAGAAEAGDANSASKLTDYADSLLSASRDIYGSGAGYAADFNRVLDALSGITGASDALTNSFLAQQVQAQTDALVTSIDTSRNDLLAGITALRREVQQLNA